VRLLSRVSLICLAAFAIAIFLANAAPLLAQASFGALSLGMSAADVPVTCRITFCEGRYGSDWVRLGMAQDKVDTIEVIYDGKTLDGLTVGGAPITLSEAVNRHSLAYTQSPKFGNAVDLSGKRYGVADFVSGIVYTLEDPEDPTANSIVTEVTYVGADAPVIVNAKASMRAILTQQVIFAAHRLPVISFAPRIVGAISPRYGIVEAELVNGDLKPARFAKVYAFPGNTGMRFKNQFTQIAQKLNDVKNAAMSQPLQTAAEEMYEELCAKSLRALQLAMSQPDSAGSGNSPSGIIVTSADEMGEFTLKGMSSGPYLIFSIGKVGLNSAFWMADSTSFKNGQKIKLTRPTISCYDPGFAP
jgi:hypothetical protein